MDKFSLETYETNKCPWTPSLDPVIACKSQKNSVQNHILNFNIHHNSSIGILELKYNKYRGNIGIFTKL